MIRLLFNELCVVCGLWHSVSVSVCRTTIDTKNGFPRTLSSVCLGLTRRWALRTRLDPACFVGRERLGEGEGGRLCSIWVVTGEE